MPRIGFEVEALPRCLEPGHEYFRVWRDGFKGTAPARRQRFRCMDPDNRMNWHRFTLPVLRVAAHDDRCLGCQQHVPAHAGPVVAEGYHYLSKVVAGALALVARGSTYSAASAAARSELAHLGGQDTTGVEFSTHGQLAADWTEVFTDVVLLRERVWPDQSVALCTHPAVPRLVSLPTGWGRGGRFGCLVPRVHPSDTAGFHVTRASHSGT